MVVAPHGAAPPAGRRLAGAERVAPVKGRAGWMVGHDHANRHVPEAKQAGHTLALRASRSARHP
jgi:hypothetical protein